MGRFSTPSGTGNSFSLSLNPHPLATSSALKVSTPSLVYTTRPASSCRRAVGCGKKLLSLLLDVFRPTKKFNVSKDAGWNKSSMIALITFLLVSVLKMPGSRSVVAGTTPVFRFCPGHVLINGSIGFNFLGFLAICYLKRLL